MQQHVSAVGFQVDANLALCKPGIEIAALGGQRDQALLDLFVALVIEGLVGGDGLLGQQFLKRRVVGAGAAHPDVDLAQRHRLARADLITGQPVARRRRAATRRATQPDSNRTAPAPGGCLPRPAGATKRSRASGGSGWPSSARRLMRKNAATLSRSSPSTPAISTVSPPGSGSACLGAAGSGGVSPRGLPPGRPDDGQQNNPKFFHVVVSTRRKSSSCSVSIPKAFRSTQRGSRSGAAGRYLPGTVKIVGHLPRRSGFGVWLVVMALKREDILAGRVEEKVIEAERLGVTTRLPAEQRRASKTAILAELGNEPVWAVRLRLTHVEPVHPLPSTDNRRCCTVTTAVFVCSPRPDAAPPSGRG